VATRHHRTALEGLACVVAARGDGSAAACLLGAASWWRETRHRPATRLEAADRARAEAAALEELGEAAFRTAYGEGSARPRIVAQELETAAPA
jgi:hypothetical protein